MVDEFQLIKDVKLLIERAKREGAATLPVPRWMLEQLVEKATRPHE